MKARAITIPATSTADPKIIPQRSDDHNQAPETIPSTPMMGSIPPNAHKPSEVSLSTPVLLKRNAAQSYRKSENKYSKSDTKYAMNRKIPN